LQLLSLPAISNGFTALPHSISDTESNTSRRDRDNDSRGANVGVNQPIKIQVVGASVVPSAPRSNTLQQCIKRILARDSGDGKLPVTYEDIYSQCLAAVCVLNTGESLYQTLKLELEQSVSRLATELKNDLNPAQIWLKNFVDVCEWFETQVVWSPFLNSTCTSLLS
jgi:cullin-4